MSLATVDLMIVDPRLSGVAELVEAVRLRQGCLRVVAAVEHGAPAVCRGVEAVLEKPRDAAERDSFAGNWLAAIHVILREDQA